MESERKIQVSTSNLFGPEHRNHLIQQAVKSLHKSGQFGTLEQMRMASSQRVVKSAKNTSKELERKTPASSMHKAGKDDERKTPAIRLDKAGKYQERNTTVLPLGKSGRGQERKTAALPLDKTEDKRAHSNDAHNGTHKYQNDRKIPASPIGIPQENKAQMSATNRDRNKCEIPPSSLEKKETQYPHSSAQISGRNGNGTDVIGKKGMIPSTSEFNSPKTTKDMTDRVKNLSDKVHARSQNTGEDTRRNPTQRHNSELFKKVTEDLESIEVGETRHAKDRKDLEALKNASTDVKPKKPMGYSNVGRGMNAEKEKDFKSKDKALVSEPLNNVKEDLKSSKRNAKDSEDMEALKNASTDVIPKRPESSRKVGRGLSAEKEKDLKSKDKALVSEPLKNVKEDLKSSKVVETRNAKDSKDMEALKNASTDVKPKKPDSNVRRRLNAEREKDFKSKDKALVEEIVKSSPHLALSVLSLQSKFAPSENTRERTSGDFNMIKIRSRDNSESELSKSQKECLFLELKKVVDEKNGLKDSENDSASSEGPINSDEQRKLEKIMKSWKGRTLVVSEQQEGSGDQDVIDGPIEPLNLSRASQSAKYTRTPITSATNPIRRKSLDGDVMAELVHIIAEDADFDYMMEHNLNDNCLVPEDSRVTTSQIGRRSSYDVASFRSEIKSPVPDVEEETETIEWKRGNQLGRGAYGQVWCGLTNRGELIAVKQIELNINDKEQAEEEYEKIQDEVELLKTLKHPNVIGYLGTSLEDSHVNIFMELVPGGSIASILARFGALGEAVFCRYTRQILKGLAYLHKNHVVHRDIKGANIMVMHNGVIKLIDFGCAKRLCLSIKAWGDSHGRLLKSMRGTPYWMAPEVINETGYGTKSDIWSLGCTVYEMATTKPPRSDLNPAAAIFAIGSHRDEIHLPDTFSIEAQDFVRECTLRDPKLRPTATVLLLHPFLEKKKSTDF